MYCPTHTNKPSFVYFSLYSFHLIAIGVENCNWCLLLWSLQHVPLLLLKCNLIVRWKLPSQQIHRILIDGTWVKFRFIYRGWKWHKTNERKKKMMIKINSSRMQWQEWICVFIFMWDELSARDISSIDFISRHSFNSNYYDIDDERTHKGIMELHIILILSFETVLICNGIFFKLPKR